MPQDMQVNTTIPYTVIGGYLGAGKTTLLNHLLRNSQGLRLAVLVNDFGDINIDADLIVSHDGETINLASGCICCSLADGFMQALYQVSKRADAIDHVVVEASGVADPVRIGQYGAILKLDLEGVIVLVDTEQIRDKAANKYVGETVIRQLKGADLLVLNKVDLVTPGVLADVRAWLSTTAPGVRIVESTRGQVPAPMLLGALTQWPSMGGAAHEARAGENVAHAAMYATASFMSPTPLNRQNLCALLDGLPEGVLRAKGFVFLAEAPTRRHLLELVGRRWTLAAGEPWGDATPETKLIFIGLPGSIDPAAIEHPLLASTGNPS